MSVASKIPPLRFKGFEGEWEEKKLGNVGGTVSGVGFPEKEQGGQTGVPFYKVSDMNNVGNEVAMTNSNNYVTDEQIKKNHWHPIVSLPAVIFAKVGAAVFLNRKRLVRTPFLMDNNTMAYLPDDSWDGAFCKMLFDTINLPSLSQGGALPSYNGKDVEELLACVPMLPEQRKVAGLSSGLDMLIESRGTALEKLQTLKKAMLEKMFPRAGAKVPEVRFKGFAGEWERKPLGEMVKKRNESVLSGVLPKLEYEDIVSFEGVLKRSSDQLYVEKRGISFYVGDVLFGKLRPYLGNWFHATFDGVAVGDWWVLKPVSVVSEYLYVLIQSDAFQVAANQSAGSKMPRADWNLVSETLYPIPPTAEEQRFIGAYFRSLDALISARQEEVGKLKDLKKALLDRMFV